MTDRPASRSTSRPAATVVVARPSDESPCGLEILLLRRSEVGAFAGMWVFPGGRVDEADRGDDDRRRAARAAVREAEEEVGLRLRPDSLVTWSHWTPPESAPVRFTTWFFIAPWDGSEVRVDGREIVEHRWLTPDAALAAGLPMAPPTIVTLHEIHEAGRPEAVWAGPVAPPAYVTRPSRRADGTAVLLWHGDAGYESGDADAPGSRNRLVMPDGLAGPRWTYERQL